MKYRNMKTGQEREFIQGMKFDSYLWKPIQRIRTGSRATVTVTEVHPEDFKSHDKTIMGEEKPAEIESKQPAPIVKAVQKARAKEASKEESL